MSICYFGADLTGANQATDNVRVAVLCHPRLLLMELYAP